MKVTQQEIIETLLQSRDLVLIDRIAHANLAKRITECGIDVAHIPRTDDEILKAILPLELPDPMPLTYESGPYSITTPTHSLRTLVRAVIWHMGVSSVASKPEMNELDTDAQLIRERDHLEEVLDQILDLVLGTDREEWSTSYDYNNAIDDVVERMVVPTSQWQPIETAPLHKLVIICDKTKKTEQGIVYKLAKAGLREGASIGDIFGYFSVPNSWNEVHCKPIAWMPLPEYKVETKMDFSDAYAGAMEDKRMYKKRWIAAEKIIRNLVEYLQVVPDRIKQHGIQIDYVPMTNDEFSDLILFEYNNDDGDPDDYWYERKIEQAVLARLGVTPLSQKPVAINTTTEIKKKPVNKRGGIRPPYDPPIIVGHYPKG